MTLEVLAALPAFEALAGAVRHAFPDPRVDVSNQLVAAVAQALPEDARVRLFGDAVGVLAEVAGTIAAGFEHDDPSVIAHYIAKATHTRMDLRTGELVHSFTALLPMVHYELPDVEQRDLPTKAGILAAGDMPLYTRKVFTDHYSGTVLAKATRVTAVAPPRFLGARFAAIASMLATLPNDQRAWVLVGGMATGESVMLYASMDGKAIERTAWYAPTPFSANENHYTGLYEFDEEGAPTKLHVDVRMPQKPTHLTVSVEYQRFTPQSVLWPAELTMQAAARVALIAQRLGKSMGSGLVADLVMPLLAEVGRGLEWRVKPAIAVSP